MQPAPAARRYVADLSTRRIHDRWSGGVCPELERLVRSGILAGVGIGLAVRRLSWPRESDALPRFVIGGRDSEREWRHAGFLGCEQCLMHG